MLYNPLDPLHPDYVAQQLILCYLNGRCTPATGTAAGCAVSGGAIATPLSISNNVTTFVGEGPPGGTGSYVNAVGTGARFSGPIGIAMDPNGAFYVFDAANYVLRKVDIASAAVTTFSGAGGPSAHLDGTSDLARFKGPRGITSDCNAIYVTDGDTVRSVSIATGSVSTIAGLNGATSLTDGTGTAAQFNGPQGVTVVNGFLYVTENNNHTIRRVEVATGVVTTLAGANPAQPGSYVDATGTAARFNQPVGLATDGTNLYVADFTNNRIRQVVISTGVVTTIAGDGTPASLDGTGVAARINQPVDVVYDGAVLWIAEFGGTKIRRMNLATGAVTTLAGSFSGYTNAAGNAAQFNQVQRITVDGRSLFVTDQATHSIRMIQ